MFETFNVIKILFRAEFVGVFVMSP